MNDHFWPSLYPGIIVGGLVGLAKGGLLTTIVGGAGGVAGAALAYFVVVWFGLQDGLVSLGCLITGAVAGSYAFAELAARTIGLMARNR
jgi:hypothetical protein